MNTADFNKLSESEKRHVYKCTQCGEMVDRRQLDGVLFHETDHNTAARSESKNERAVFHARLRSAPAQRSSPRRSNFRCAAIWPSVYGEPNAISNVAFIAPQVLATKVCGVQPLILAVQSAILGKLTQGQ
jgi:hypothetical protein